MFSKNTEPQFVLDVLILVLEYGDKGALREMVYPRDINCDFSLHKKLAENDFNKYPEKALKLYKLANAFGEIDIYYSFNNPTKYNILRTVEDAFESSEYNDYGQE